MWLLFIQFSAVFCNSGTLFLALIIIANQSISHKAALLPQMDSSVVFARLLQCAPPSDTCFLAPTCSHSTSKNNISISSAIFVELMADCPYTLQWAAIFSLKVSPLHGGSGPHLILGSLGPPESSTKWHLHCFSHFCGAHNCNKVTDWQTTLLRL